MNHENDIVTTLESPEAMDTHSPLTIEAVHDNTGFHALRNEWNTLAVSSMSTIYQTHDWAFLWWKHFGAKPNRRLFILTLCSDNVIVGIAPFFMDEETLFGVTTYRRLKLIGSGTAFQASFGMFLDDGPSDYLDIIAAPGFEQQVMHAIAEYFHQSIDRIDEIEFLNLPQESRVYSLLIPTLEKSGFTCSVSKADVCPYLPVPTSLNEYLQNVSPSVRRRLNQAQKAAEEGTLYTISTMHSLEDCSSALEHIITLHQQRWNRIGYPGLFADKRFRAFQHELLAAVHRNGWLWCKTADANGTCVAARLGFTFNNIIFDYLSGFDDAAPSAKRRPGLALLLSMIRDAVEGNMRAIDFLRGDEPYKFELTSDVKYNWNITATPASQGGIRSLMHRCSATLAFARFIVSRELRLIGVQSRRHRFPMSLVHYVKFRSPRLTRKISALFGTNGNPAHTSQEDA